MINPLIVLGGGGHAKVLIDALISNNEKILGIIDPNLEIGSLVLEVPVIGGEVDFDEFTPNNINLVNALGSTTLPLKRQQIFQHYKKLGYRFASIIHPSAVVSSFSCLGEGVQLMAGCIINPGTQIGDNCLINTKSSVDHDCLLGDHVHLAPGVTLSGEVKIGDCVHVGVGASVIQGICIGRETLVASGSVVVKDVLPRSVVMGVPARQVQNK
jgi:UDP-perosamine 4-acetyltransferase